MTTAEGVFPKIGNDPVYASEVNNFAQTVNIGATSFQNLAQCIFNADYIGWNAKLNVASGAPNFSNLKRDIFASNTATYWTNMDYYSTDKLWQTMDFSAMTDYYIDIYTTTDTGISALAINNCLTKEMSRTSTSRVYRMYCTAGTAGVKRAQILKTLFYGTNGADYKVTGITGLTALKTSLSTDVGAKFQIAIWTGTGGGLNGVGHKTATFSDTSTNVVHSWSYLADTDNQNQVSYQMPKGTDGYNPTNVLNTCGVGPSDETGTDTSAENKNQPANYGFTFYNGHGHMETIVIRMLVRYTVGTISWAAFVNDGGGCAETTFTTYDFGTIPAMTLIDYSTTATSSVTFATTSLPTITNCLSTWNISIDSENTLAVTISADATNYETVTNATLHRFTNTGTNLYVKFNITRVDTAASDKISEYAIFYNL